MKRLFSLLLLAVLLLSGCAKTPAPVATPADQVILDQVSGPIDDKTKNQLLEEMHRSALGDVNGLGRYIVVFSDTTGLNSFTLHYEDGFLKHVYTSFRKSAQDTPMETYFTGEPLEDYHYKSIRFVQYTAEDLAALLAAEGFAQVSILPTT